MASAGRDRVRLQPSGAYAANLLGLSEQVPAKVVFLTDGSKDFALAPAWMHQTLKELAAS